jgi:hypothetical protein
MPGVRIDPVGTIRDARQLANSQPVMGALTAGRRLVTVR